MNRNRFANALQIAANFGIVAGLVLVGLQMNQNEQLLRLQITNQYFEAYIATDAALMGENFPEIYQKSVEAPQELTLAEMRVMESQTFFPLSRWISLFRMSEAGLMDDRMWKRQVEMDAEFYFSNTYGRAWWERASEVYSESFLPLELRAYISAQLSQAPLNAQVAAYEDVQKRIREQLAAEANTEKP